MRPVTATGVAPVPVIDGGAEDAVCCYSRSRQSRGPRYHQSDTDARQTTSPRTPDDSSAMRRLATGIRPGDAEQ